MRPFIQHHTTRSFLRPHTCLTREYHHTSLRRGRVSQLKPPPRQQRIRPQGHQHSPPAVTVRSSYSSSYIFVLLFACGSAIVYEYYFRESQPSASPSAPAAPPTIEELPLVEDERNPDYDSMAIPEGCIGNLTPHQEAKLREFWALTLKTFAVVDPDARPVTPPPAPAVPAQTPQETPKRRGRLGSLFSRGGRNDAAEDTTPASPSSMKTIDEYDKYGQTAELQQILKTQSPEALRLTYWEMMKADYPDALMLRFLRARKWDVNRALAMMISTIDWRNKQMQVDEDIMVKGESGALADSELSDPTVKREGHDFLAQLRMGKSFIHGADKDGRPITYVRVRLHRGGEQTERSLERYTVFVIELARLTLKQPVETGAIVFDMTGFTLANMDYTPVKFMIKVFEANYPESLGIVLVHKAPWIFQGIWKIIRGWLDPVVAAKVHFTNTVEDMETFIPKNQIISDLGGDDEWEYKYIECVEGENAAMGDTATRDRLREERRRDVADFQHKTFQWFAAVRDEKADDVVRIKKERDDLAQKLFDNYWHLDPYVRARSLYDRVGMIGHNGKIDFYPQHTLKTENLNGNATSGAPAPAADPAPAATTTTDTTTTTNTDPSPPAPAAQVESGADDGVD